MGPGPHPACQHHRRPVGDAWRPAQPRAAFGKPQPSHAPERRLGEAARCLREARRHFSSTASPVCFPPHPAPAFLSGWQRSSCTVVERRQHVRKANSNVFPPANGKQPRLKQNGVLHPTYSNIKSYFPLPYESRKATDKGFLASGRGNTKESSPKTTCRLNFVIKKLGHEQESIHPNKHLSCDRVWVLQPGDASGSGTLPLLQARVGERSGRHGELGGAGRATHLPQKHPGQGGAARSDPAGGMQCGCRAHKALPTTEGATCRAGVLKESRSVV